MALPDWAIGVNSVILTILLGVGLIGAFYLGYPEYLGTVVSLWMECMTFLVGGYFLVKHVVAKISSFEARLNKVESET